MRFQGKTAVVTGGGGGMGSAICLAFAGEGADVAVLDINYSNASNVADKVVQLGHKGQAYEVDVSNFSKVEEVTKQIIAEFKHIDILVNTAGASADFLPFSELTEEIWDRCIAINLKGVFNPTRAVINNMLGRRYGKIISISSVAGMVGSAKLSPYAAAKAGILGFSKSLAKELAPLGINVNVIAPGPVTSPFNDVVGQEFHQKVIEATPAGRAGTPQEIAALALFLASEDANFIVGQTISPNGGRFT